MSAATTLRHPSLLLLSLSPPPQGLPKCPMPEFWGNLRVIWSCLSKEEGLQGAMWHACACVHVCALVLFQEQKRGVLADLSLKACYDLQRAWESTENPGIHSNNDAKCQLCAGAVLEVAGALSLDPERMKEIWVRGRGVGSALPGPLEDKVTFGWVCGSQRQRWSPSGNTNFRCFFAGRT